MEDLVTIKSKGAAEGDHKVEGRCREHYYAQSLFSES
jgi:hypothetical protein